MSCVVVGDVEDEISEFMGERRGKSERERGFAEADSPRETMTNNQSKPETISREDRNFRG